MSKKKKKSKLGYTRKEIEKAIKAKAQSGTLQDIICVKKVPSQTKGVRKQLKQLKASGQYRVHGQSMILDKDGNMLPILPSWGDWIMVTYADNKAFGRILHLDHEAERTVCFVPAPHLETLGGLSEFSLSAEQKRFLVSVANELDRPAKAKQWTIKLRHPIHPEMKQTLPAWRDKPFRQVAPDELLLHNMWLIHVILAAFTAHSMAFLKRPEKIPVFGENFVLEDGNDAETLIQALRAVTFLNERGLDNAGPILGDPDWKAWKDSPERLVVNRGTGKAIRTLREMLTERDRLLKCGAPVAPMTTVPILVSNSYFFSDLVNDRPIPAGIPRLSEEEQDILRTAAAKVFTPETAQKALFIMNWNLTLAGSYRRSTRLLWRDTCLELMTSIWFPEEDRREAVLRQATAYLNEEKEVLDQDSKMVADAVAFLEDPARYAERLVEKPDSLKEAKKLLESYDGIVFTPARGVFTNLQLIGFRRETLCRLLGWGVEEKRLLNTLLDRCEERGTLVNREMGLSFKSGTNLKVLAFHFAEEGGGHDD